MIKNKRVIFIILIVLLTILNVFLVLKKDTSVIEKSKVIKIERKEFAIYKQNADTKEYDITNDNKFPEIGYLLNETKTKCYGYNKEEIETKPIQELTNGVINGKVTIESSKTIYCEIYFDIDNKVPEINTFEIKEKTSDGEELTNGYTYEYQDLPYQLEYKDEDVAQYCISDNETCTEWKEIDTKTDTLTIDNSDGTKTIYAYIKDKANNISEVSQYTITVDRTKPVVTSFTLTGTSDENQTLSNSAQYTHTRNITYNATITEDNIESYCVYEDGNSCNYNRSTSTTITNQSYILANETEGIHTINIKVKDKAGNESTVSTKKITLDKTNPTATISSKSVTTDSITVTVGYTGNDISGIVQRQCKINDQATWTDAEPNGECTISSLDDGTKLEEGTEYTIEARVKDGSGRYSTNNSSISVTTDKKGITGKDLIIGNNKPKGLSDKILGESPNNSSTYNDDMYRFVGACNAGDNSGKGCDGKVDNFVCFGYDNPSQCVKNTESGVDLDNDYIYRIIGITRDGRMKLIKNTAIREESNINYVWNNNYELPTVWPNLYIYKRLNGKSNGDTQGYNGNTNIFIDSTTSNVQYIQSSGSEEDKKWYNKIDNNHQWAYGKIYKDNINKSANDIYEIESGQQKVIQNYGESAVKWTNNTVAAIGLMYVSDYYYSYVSSGTDSSNTNCYNNISCKDSWMHISNNGKNDDYQFEWTMTGYGKGSNGYYSEWIVNSNGAMRSFYSSTTYRGSVRPVFFLNSDVVVSEGSGTSTDPFIIKK